MSENSLSNYIMHMRPRSWAVVGGHMAVGFAVACGNRIIGGEVPSLVWLRFLGALALWTIFLNGGTLALNSAHDMDEGDVGYLKNPPPIPRNLSNFGTLIMFAGLLMSAAVGARFMLVYGLCFVLSILYSVPPIRMKSRAGFDLLINSAGYGMLTFLAGFTASGRQISPEAWMAAAGYFALFAGFYPLTQLYQLEEDMRHGDQTFAVALGRGGALMFSVFAVSVAFGAFFIYAGYYDGGAWKLVLPAAFVVWLGILIPWLLKKEDYPEKKGMYRALKSWGLTDLAVALIALFLF